MPKASVIIPTIPLRSNLLKQTEKYLARQTFQDFEVVVNKHETDCIPKKRNDAIRSAKTSKIVLRDDDDWWADDSLEKQMKELNNPGVKLCGTSEYYVWCTYLELAEQVSNGSILGGTVAFDKSIWEQRPYNENWLKLSDAEFVLYHLQEQKRRDPIKASTAILDMHDLSLMVYIIHGSNTNGKLVTNKYTATNIVKKILGADLPYIQQA